MVDTDEDTMPFHVYSLLQAESAKFCTIASMKVKANGMISTWTNIVGQSIHGRSDNCGLVRMRSV